MQGIGKDCAHVQSKEGMKIKILISAIERGLEVLEREANNWWGPFSKRL